MGKKEDKKFDKKLAKSMGYAAVELGGSVWDFRIGEDMRGKLKRGDEVVVLVPEEGSLYFRCGKVRFLKARTDHSERNVYDIVDKVDVERYEKRKAKEHKLEVMKEAACSRAADLAEIADLRKVAELMGDDELMTLVARIERAEGCPAAQPSPGGEAPAAEGKAPAGPVWADGGKEAAVGALAAAREAIAAGGGDAK